MIRSIVIIGFTLFSLFVIGCSNGDNSDSKDSSTELTTPPVEIVEVNGTEILKNNEEMEDLGKQYFEGQELNTFKDKLSELENLGVEDVELNYYTDDNGNILGIEVN